ncbi:preprotein translocase subunit YajC, partial [Streptococcus thermophilus]|nr:preprotein translocase subunit YajC [Streptococcus thermophilus]
AEAAKPAEEKAEAAKTEEAEDKDSQE